MKFKVYGKPQCSFCVRAKMLLESKGIEYEYVDLLKDVEAMAYIKSSGAKTVPQIYDITEETPTLVGGFEDLQKLIG
jgi:glutaredoxin